MAVVLHEITDSDFEYYLKLTTTGTNSAASILDVSDAEGAATDHATPTIESLGSVEAPSAAEASTRDAAEFVPVVVALSTYSKSESTISCNTTAIVHSYIDNISFSK